MRDKCTTATMTPVMSARPVLPRLISLARTDGLVGRRDRLSSGTVPPELAHPQPPGAEHDLAGDPVQPQPVLRRRRNGVRPAQRYDEDLSHQVGHGVEVIAGPAQHVAEDGLVITAVKRLYTIGAAIRSRLQAAYMTGGG
jgi:hypothetical protein